jgi:hypothetical protein
VPKTDRHHAKKDHRCDQGKRRLCQMVKLFRILFWWNWKKIICLTVIFFEFPTKPEHPQKFVHPPCPA